MANSFLTSFLSALQASVSVLLTIFYGVAAAQFDLLDDASAKRVSVLCVKLFLPALLLTNIGSELDQESGPRYLSIVVWALIYNILSILLGTCLRRLFKMPRWVTPAVTFNNTIAMPLLLLDSLGKTGLLEPLLWGADDSTTALLSRAKSYFLVNSMVSDTLTFGVGPKLLGVQELEAEARPDVHEAAFLAGHMEDNPDDGDLDPVRTAQRSLYDGEEEAVAANEETSLLPAKMVSATTKMTMRTRNLGMRYYDRSPSWLQVAVDWGGVFLSAPLIAAAIGVVIGIVPPLHTAFFASPENGGVFNATITESVEQIGGLFAALQIVIVGVKLCKALKQMKHGKDGGAVPWGATVSVLFVRFVLWPAISIPVIWAVATQTTILDDDPVLYFSMMLMPTGPPALGLIALADVAGDSEDDKMSIAKFLTIAYAISPVITFVVVGALKASIATLPS